MTDALIGMGSNVGDRLAYLRRAAVELSRLPDSRLIAASHVYETAPVGLTAQPPFLNAAVRLATARPPRDLLEDLLAVEQRAHRHRTEKWGPRTLDLDLLFYADQIIDQPGLTIPHPRLHERWFALKPLSDVAPDFTHPRMGKTIRALLDELDLLAPPGAPIEDALIPR